MQVGALIPDVTLREHLTEPQGACAVGLHVVKSLEAARGKAIVAFAVPGAFTPTCSEKHLPGYVALAAPYKAAGVDEVWCLSVNDAYVMSAWGMSQRVGAAVRMLADGSGEFTRAMGLTLDLEAKGLGQRSKRYAMLLQDGFIRALQVEPDGAFGVSAAPAMLELAQKTLGSQA
jgi:peroxiredoxin